MSLGVSSKQLPQLYLKLTQTQTILHPEYETQEGCQRW